MERVYGYRSPCDGDTTSLLSASIEYEWNFENPPTKSKTYHITKFGSRANFMTRLKYACSGGDMFHNHQGTNRKPRLWNLEWYRNKLGLVGNGVQQTPGYIRLQARYSLFLFEDTIRSTSPNNLA